MTCVDGWSPTDLNWTPEKANASELQGSDNQHSQHSIWESDDQPSFQPKEHETLAYLLLLVRSDATYSQHLSNMHFQLRQLQFDDHCSRIINIVKCLCLLSVWLLKILYAGLPACDIAQLHSVQNAAERLSGGLSKYDSVTPVLRDVLHCLLIKERINLRS